MELTKIILFMDNKVNEIMFRVASEEHLIRQILQLIWLI